MAAQEAESPGARRRERLAAARLYLIVEARTGERRTEDWLPEALAGGVDIVQLRDKAAGESELVRAGRTLRRLCDEHSALLLLNDRPELAAACEADGVHLGQDDLALDDARSVVGPELLIGVSTHSPEQVDAAERSTADYLGVGPVHRTPTKPGATPVGYELVWYAAESARKPFFAIGGIDPANAADAARAGATRLAVVRAIRDAPDPGAAARALRAALEMEVTAGSAR